MTSTSTPGNVSSQSSPPAWLAQVQVFNAPDLEHAPTVNTRDPASVGPALAVIADALAAEGVK